MIFVTEPPLSAIPGKLIHHTTPLSPLIKHYMGTEILDIILQSEVDTCRSWYTKTKNIGEKYNSVTIISS